MVSRNQEVTMFRKIAIVLGGAAVIVALPMGALAMTGPAAIVDDGSSDAAVLQEQTRSQVQVQNQVRMQDPVDIDGTDIDEPIVAQEQTATRERLRGHAETGIPEGVEPVQKRLQLHDPGTGLADGETGGAGIRNGNGPNEDAPRSGDGTGVCTNEDGPIGSGPHSGQQGRSGSGS